MDTAKAKQDLIAAEAAEWLVHLQSDNATADDRTEFADWLRRSPEHVAEYLAAAETWVASGSSLESYSSAEVLIAEAAGDDSNVIVLPGRNSHWSQWGKSRQKAYWGLAAAGIATAVVGVALLLWREKDSDRHYVTAEGERLTISLEEGSVVHLNARSEIRVRLDKRRRLIELEQGEARFHVARDSRRPFEVVTDRAAVKALGTVFNVYRGREGTRVTVVEGRVEVRQAARESVASDRSEAVAGEEVAVLASGRLDKKRARDIEQVLAWTQHRLAFRSRPLSEVIGEFNRYNVPAMRVENATLGGLEISGAFQADDPQSLLSYLQKHEGVVVSRRESGEIVLHGGERK
jgi:transmembrane sensor